MSEGYIKLYKKMRDWGWYGDPATKIVFLELLLSAAWAEGEYRGVKVMPGDCIVGRKELAERLGLTEQNVRTALSHLEKTGEITRRATNKFTVVTIANWAFYQGGNGLTNQQANQQLTNNQPTTNQQLTTSKNIKNIRTKEDKTSKAPEDLYPSNFMEAWNSICIDLPKVKTMTDARRKKIHARLEDFSESDIIEAMMKIQESDFLSGREGGWKANFDWLFLNSTNMAKVLEGNYQNKQPRKTRTESDFEAARRRIQEQYERVTQFGERTASS